MAKWTGLGFVVILGACGGGGETMAEALAKADAAAKAEKAAEIEQIEALRAAKKEEAPDPKALPWTIADLQDSMKIGTKLTYTMSGINAKGKAVDDTFLIEIKGVSDENGTAFVAFPQSQAKNAAVQQVQSRGWDRFSPVFPVEKPSAEVVGRETIEVPAGAFECSVAELKGFFGEHYSIWMVVDKPGVYAKVIDHGREESDKTEVTYELAKVERPA